jgi:riboflavin biosynthesis pyrimidine reductase
MTDQIVFRRLLPDPPAELASGELVAALAPIAPAPADRPCTAVNFIESADGRATFHGRSGKLGDEGDRALFHALRERAEAVLVGTGTLEIERYGRLIREPERRARRAARGLAPEPLLCTITRSGRLPRDIPLFAEPEARVLVLSGAEIDDWQPAANVEVLTRDAAGLTVRAVLHHLHAELGIGSVLCEGGPTLFAAMVHEDVADELFLTLSPKLAGGGEGLAITSGDELPEPASLQLVSVLERQGTLFLRYSRP